ncbi:hypothetical protein CesoFtcFv8_024624 [Champsocephalus esox]|uniref:Uncharacterized protein n=1 Tax=Champsocephalus esox TaxID=159716 RepID=A0AAN8GII2_9TELE|nr:hypothetical protein CesoFtcFv8_024624 [Champsocephalus esox]
MTLYIVPQQGHLDDSPLPFNATEFSKMPLVANVDRACHSNSSAYIWRSAETIMLNPMSFAGVILKGNCCGDQLSYLQFNSPCRILRNSRQHMRAE